LMYTQGKGRKVHIVILVPSISVAEKINSYLDIESELGGRLKSEIIQLENYPTHYLHSLRCGCYALKITDYLKKIEPVVFIGQIKNYTDSNFKKYQQIFYIASLLHDVGKREFPELITKTDLTEEEIILLRGHVEKSRDIIKSINETSAEIALRHHLYQPKSYPYGINGSTPEIEVLSRLLGKIDNWDTRTTRVNNRNNYNYYEKAIIMFNKIKNNNNFIPPFNELFLFNISNRPVNQFLNRPAGRKNKRNCSPRKSQLFFHFFTVG